MPARLAAELQTSLTAGGGWPLLLAFLGGCLTGFNPCSYPTVPVLLGLIGAQGQRPRWQAPALAATFVLGMGLTYALLGLTVGAAGSLLGLAAGTWRYLTAGVCLFFGLVWTGLIELRWGAWVPFADYRPAAGSFGGALLLGLLFGLIASPCATPMLAVILSASAAEGSPLRGAGLLLAYALGHGLPLLLVGACAGAATRLRQLGPHLERLQRAGGWLLVAVAFWLVWR
ncbi:MAG: sulfite exporter TauE/SafE family protein [Fimbriimonadaceae bacterium]|nr:sulfite exporter TauE/SafE family protein [Fimbriimonadaceae bacterium]